MRVVAGSARGRRLRTPEGVGTRPTSDRVREAVFNALFSRGGLDGATIVDLFAGSGALGIEALSRGAAHCWFVETDREASRVIVENLEVLGFADRATVLCRDVDAALEDLPEAVDVVFADPPYAFDGWVALLGAVGPRLSEEGLVVAESDRSVPVPDGWEKLRERAYGGTVITFTVPSAGTGVDA